MKLKKGLLSFGLVLSMLLALFPAMTIANAKVGLTDNELKDAFENLVMDACWYGKEATFSANEKIPDAVAIYYLHTSGQLDPYAVPDSWYYDLSYAEFMKLMDDNFVNHSDMRDYLIGVDSLDETTDMIHFFGGGMGGSVAFVPTNVYKDNDNYRVQGVVLDAIEASDWSGFKPYEDYLNAAFSEEAKRYEIVDMNQDGNPMLICNFREMTVSSDGKIVSLQPIYYLTLDGTRYVYHLDENKNPTELIGVCYSVDLKTGSHAVCSYSEAAMVDQNQFWIEKGQETLIEVNVDKGYVLDKVTLTNEGDGTTRVQLVDSNEYYDTYHIFVTLNKPSTLNVSTTDQVKIGTENGITVSVNVSDGSQYENVSLVVDQLNDKNQDVVFITNKLGEDYDVKAFDIHLEDKDGVEVRPDGTFKVTMPIPDGWDASKVSVYHVANGKMDDMKGLVSEDGKTISFTTTHFSTYVLVQDKTVTQPDVPPVTPPVDTPVTQPGAVNTADIHSTMLWIGLMMTSMIVLAGLVTKKRINQR